MMKALKIYKKNHLIHKCFSTQVPKLKNYINGEFVESNAITHFEITNPANNKLLSLVPETPDEEFNKAVMAAKSAFKSWRNVPINTRQRYMFDYITLLKENQDRITRTISEEHGKILPDSIGDFTRGLEVLETSTNVSSLMLGESIENISKGVDMYTYKHPLGVCAGICPFNFPVMIPLWMYPLAIVCGNTYIMKPSERVSNSAMILTELLHKTGLPNGVFNLVHGGRQTVTNICTHPDIKAVSFVGSNQGGEYIYRTATQNGKRTQCNMGAKNHAIIMPDADKEDTINALVGACFGSSGQRCMAITTTIFVGNTYNWLDEIKDKIKNLTVGDGLKSGIDLGPITTKQSLNRIHKIIEEHEKEGGKVLVDGRNIKLEYPYSEGNFIGPTILTDLSTNMTAYKEEIFGPVMCVLKANSLEDAMKIINENEYGNGAAIFTKSGSNARKFQRDIEAGQVGINLPIPVPLPMLSFTGNKKSFLGDINFYGKNGINFFTQQKSIVSRWKEDSEASQKISTAMPTHK